jgi:acetylornithine/N-succinyldiaminopimelate aminotransferase
VPLTLKSGLGCKLTSVDGKDYLDFVSGIATCALGHANPELIEAVSNQMKQMHHVSNLYYIPQQAKLASWLCENSVADKAFFCNSGAEANEGAIKLARRHAANRGITVRICSYCFALFIHASLVCKRGILILFWFLSSILYFDLFSFRI